MELTQTESTKEFDNYLHIYDGIIPKHRTIRRLFLEPEKQINGGKNQLKHKIWKRTSKERN